ncbi:MAG: hypothetical protein IT454_01615 [Planctomycetes bacterium]|nr:hypothetical protein [Planctomycetota bacterium]
MIVVLERGASPEQIAEAVHALEKRGMTVRRVTAGGKPVLHVLSGPSSRSRRLMALEQVEGLIPTSGPRVRREGRRFFPYHVIQWAAIGIVVLGSLVLLAGQFPPGVGAPVDVQSPPAESSAPWYLRAPLALLAMFPASLAWLVMSVCVALLVLVPRLDRSQATAPSRGLRVLLAAVVLAALAFATLRGGAL